VSAYVIAARAWLEARGDDVPSALRTRMQAAVAGVDPAAAASVPLTLGAAAVSCLREALARCDERGAALHLLAADGLITAAHEAAADSDDASAALRELWHEYEPARLAALTAEP
jgi:DnaJ-domain-containing protein 1